MKGDDTVGKGSYPAEPANVVRAEDGFVAGLLPGRLRARSTEDCLRLANSCGACASNVSSDAENKPSEEDALALV